MSENKAKTKAVPEEELEQIVNRLYNTQIAMTTMDTNTAIKAEDKISRKNVSHGELTEIIERLSTTYPKCQSKNIQQPAVCVNIIGKEPRTKEEVQEIYSRLRSTHTKSSSGGQPCKTIDGKLPPGHGTKCYQIVEGIESRFKGDKPVSKEEFSEKTEYFLKTQTTASQARLDNPKVLLYPECTKLVNNVERIRMFQATGATVKQKEMARREKWYN